MYIVAEIAFAVIWAVQVALVRCNVLSYFSSDARWLGIVRNAGT